ncbi:glycoside hydrolase family 36 protein [Egicoccus sp. AB-alg2]|uniref:glycoside hydrolase family 36 protein n=1 Tax=Egicoccus sp. AB-alg2 TaxID=3242693 RepID=UPI00359D1F18
MTFHDVDEVVVDPQRGRVHEHGWQSWSPVGTHPLHVTTPRPETDVLHTMRFRPETPAPAAGAQGEGLLVVDPGTGAPVRLYATVDASETVASIRTRLVGDRLVVSADGPVVRDQIEADLQTALATFGDRFAAANDLPAPRAAPTVWCSWYHYFLDVTEADLAENLAGIVDHRLPVDVVQLDDGWQARVGDWRRQSDRFHSVAAVADRIRDAGLRAGIWVAPFTAVADSELVRANPGWLVDADAGHNWDQPLRALDLTHPGVQQELDDVFGRLREWGFDYVKLDFLYTGAVPGARHDDVTGIAAYRDGLQRIRAAVGEDTYLLACGAPVLPSAGLVDAMRVSPDTYHPAVGTDAVQHLRSVPNTVARAWQHGRFWVNDPDCLVLRPSAPWREEWAEVVARHGGLRGFSDRVADLDDWGLRTAHRLLGEPPLPVPFDAVADAAPKASPLPPGP